MRQVSAALVQPADMKTFIFIIAVSVATWTGCAQMQGRSTQTYHSDYHAAVRASSDALQNLEIPILREVSDELKTEFLARRPSGKPVTVEVIRVDLNFTRISISTGAGIDRFLDKEVLDQIHGFIRGRLTQTTVED